MLKFIATTIILGSPNTVYNKLKITLGGYSQVYIGTTNSTNQRTVGEIELCPSNKRIRYYSTLLATGKQYHLNIWTDLPIIEQVIHRLDELSTKVKQPNMTKEYPFLKWTPVIQIMDQYVSENVPNRKPYD